MSFVFCAAALIFVAYGCGVVRHEASRTTLLSIPDYRLVSTIFVILPECEPLYEDHRAIGQCKDRDHLRAPKKQIPNVD